MKAAGTSNPSTPSGTVTNTDAPTISTILSALVRGLADRLVLRRRDRRVLHLRRLARRPRRDAPGALGRRATRSRPTEAASRPARWPSRRTARSHLPNGPHDGLRARLSRPSKRRARPTAATPPTQWTQNAALGTRRHRWQAVADDAAQRVALTAEVWPAASLRVTRPRPSSSVRSHGSWRKVRGCDAVALAVGAPAVWLRLRGRPRGAEHLTGCATRCSTPPRAAGASRGSLHGQRHGPVLHRVEPSRPSRDPTKNWLGVLGCRRPRAGHADPDRHARAARPAAGPS